MSDVLLSFVLYLKTSCSDVAARVTNDTSDVQTSCVSQRADLDSVVSILFDLTLFMLMFHVKLKVLSNNTVQFQQQIQTHSPIGSSPIKLFHWP